MSSVGNSVRTSLIQKQESVSWQTTRRNAEAVTQESGLELKIIVTPTRVETEQP